MKDLFPQLLEDKLQVLALLGDYISWRKLPPLSNDLSLPRYKNQPYLARSILRETCTIILAPELTWAHLNHSPPSPLPSPVSFPSFAQMVILGILPSKCPSWYFLSLVNPTLDICGLQCSGLWAGWILDGFSQWHVIRGGRRRCLLHASSLLPCCSLAVAGPLGLWLLPKQALLLGDGPHCFLPFLLQA